ncbi:hypothetical protein CS542_05775 [Pedobacter sp. IW39]|nr:hypothetical protein CS542_05775 [Pedobacter sp. IW39]
MLVVHYLFPAISYIVGGVTRSTRRTWICARIGRRVPPPVLKLTSSMLIRAVPPDTLRISKVRLPV